MINRNHGLPLSQQTRLLGIGRCCVYYKVRPVNENYLALIRRIDQIHLENPFMGARMLRDQLVREGIKLSAACKNLNAF